MDADRSTATPDASRDRQGRWLALVSGETRGPLASLARSGLAVLAGLYRVGLAVANLRWRLAGAGWRAPCPVVSVGNLTVGGTGKTPMVAHLAALAAAAGARPLIVSRGYGAAAGAPNEEARELAHLCPGVPHVQDPDRLRAIEDGTAAHPCDVAILDDGFQHRRCARDLDMVLIDALRPFGYGHLLPRGLLREPPSALRRADIVVITRAEQVPAERLANLKAAVRGLVRGDTLVCVAEHRPTGVLLADGSRREVGWLRGREVAAACGIGNPEAFRRTLEALGARVVRFDAFRDHYAYTRADLERLAQAALAAGAKTLVTTGKDDVKWRPLLEGGPGALAVDVAAVEVAMRITEGDDALGRAMAAVWSRSDGQGGR